MTYEIEIYYTDGFASNSWYIRKHWSDFLASLDSVYSHYINDAIAERYDARIIVLEGCHYLRFKTRSGQFKYFLEWY